MLAFSQTTTSISSDFFTGSLWETKRSDDLSEALSLLLQPKADQCFSGFLLRIISNFTIEHLPSFSEKRARKCQTTDPAKTHSNLSVPSDKSQSEPRYRGCGVTISIWCWARVILGSGRLITNTVNCSTHWMGGWHIRKFPQQSRFYASTSLKWRRFTWQYLLCWHTSPAAAFWVWKLNRNRHQDLLSIFFFSARFMYGVAWRCDMTYVRR